MARLLDQIVGHEAVIEHLQHLKRTDRWPHALLFAGPSGIGKRQCALAFAQILICERQQQGCGECPACLRVAKKQSESLILIRPDESAAKPVIKVDVIRDLLSSLSLSALGVCRVVIIDEAHTMNPQAANSLLKTLEEPMENVYFILIGEDVQQFLPTIRSRTQVIRFSYLRETELQAIRPGLPQWSYRSSRGQLDRLSLLTTEEGLKKRDEALSLFEDFCQNKEFLLWSDWKTVLKDRGMAQFSVSCWQQIVRDLMVLKTASSQFILNTDQLLRFEQLSAVGSGRLSKLAQELIYAEQDLMMNADPVLVFESLWVKYDRMD